MLPIYIIRHVSNEGPGYLADFLETRAIPYRIIKIDRGEALPADPAAVAGLVFMGGPMSVNDDLPWIAPALALIRQAHARGVPLLGHCLGGQLIAKALGASVAPNRVPEHGWLPVTTESRDRAGDWLDGIEARFEAFHWHGETFTLPAGAIRILASAYCDNQGFVIGNSLALQCHIEMTADMVHDWIAAAGDTLPAPSPSVQSPAEMATDLSQRIAAMQSVADRLYTRWIERIA